MRIIKQPLILLALMVMSSPVFAQGTPEDEYGPKAAKTDEARKRYKKNQKTYKGNSDVLVLPGLVANKKTRRVEVLVESTGLGEDEAVEFFIIDATSTQGYESLLWSHAKPSDIHKALVFIGLPAGAPRNPSDLRFWTKGELVKASIDVGAGQTVPLTDMIYDKEAEDAMQEQDFIFTGSISYPDPKDPKTSIYLADKYQPRAILPGFNSSITVLEPTWNASKGEAYQSHVPNAEVVPNAHDLLTLILEPAAKKGETRVVDLNLTVENRQTFKIADDKGKSLSDDTSVKAALDVCLGYLKKGKIPYVTLRFDEALTLAEIRQLSAAMAMLDQPNALRIEPPAPGRLYYRSFLTSPSWRDQTKRMNQYWEVHLQKDGKGLSSTMVFYEAIWKEGQSKPDFKMVSHPAPTGEAVRTRLDTDEKEREKANRVPLQPVLMVFAPADISYGTLLNFLGPALKTHKTVHLFLEGIPAQP